MSFEGGSTCAGRVLVACDGGASRVRTQLFPDHHQRHRIPVRVLGLKVFLSPEEMEPIRKLDPFFLQGTSSQNDTFLYLSSEYTFFVILFSSNVAFDFFLPSSWLLISRRW